MADQQDPPKGTIRPTRFRVLALAFAVGALLGYLFVTLTERVDTAAPQVQWTSVLALVAIAAVVLVMAWSTYRTVHRERRRIDPQRAVSFLLLAKASSLVGALLAGAYLGFALQFVDRMEADLPRERVIRALTAAVTAVVIVVSGLLLERACRIPKDDDE
ncbi:MAG: DUF3180 domain-containing protein [Nocardioidaceae bacterium]